MAKRTSLFLRILIGITIPLIFLLIAISGFLLKREIARQEIYYAQLGKDTLKNLDNEVAQLTTFSEILNSPSSLKKQLLNWEKDFDIEKLDVLDPVREVSILKLESKTGKFSDKVREHIHRSMELRRTSNTYLVIVDSFRNKLIGYLAIRDKQQNRVVVLTAQFYLAGIKEAFNEILGILFIMTGVVGGIGFLIASVLSFQIVRPINAINKACREMLAGNLGLQVKVTTGDELEEMAQNFNQMSKSLSLMQRHAADSNPLTQLPGNMEIQAELNRRIEERKKFVFYHIDIDHFKPYNDRYGLAAGDHVLKRTSDLLKEVAAEKKNGVFVGHQGGDDFILIVEAHEAAEIGDKVCKKFDESLKEFYSAEDLKQGFYFGEDTRSTSLSGDAEIKRHPLMSISLCGVSNMKREFNTHEDILNFAVGIKKKAKKIPYSKYLIEE